MVTKSNPSRPNQVAADNRSTSMQCDLSFARADLHFLTTRRSKHAKKGRDS